jgi:hypothetical protein
MESGINISVSEEQGVSESLSKDRFTQIQIDEAKELIRKQFEESVKKLFIEILDKPLPNVFYVDFAIDHDDPSSNWETLASFIPKKSRENLLYFKIYKPVVESVLVNGNNKQLQRSIFHELIHSADLSTLTHNRKLFSFIQLSRHKDLSNPIKENHGDAWDALSDTIGMFAHFRDEGVAILGERILTKTPFRKVSDSLEEFRILYGMTMLKSRLWSNSNRMLGSTFDDYLENSTYKIAPSILVLVLEHRGDIGKNLAERVLEGLETGHYSLSDEETNSIIKASFSLSLSDYIQSVTNLGEKIAPVQPFLEFCATVQKKLEDDDTTTSSDITAFTKLFEQPKTAELFHETMEQILDHISPEAGIDDFYQNFGKKKTNFNIHQHLKEKVDALYSVMKNDESIEKRKVAQLALTYLFDKKDIIHDELKGIGLVDDVTVIDYALSIIE